LYVGNFSIIFVLQTSISEHLSVIVSSPTTI